MANRIRKVTRQSWFSRMKMALVGMLFGLLFSGGAFWLLFWSEGQTVRRSQALNEGQESVISVAANEITSHYNGKLVHVTALADTQDVLSDPEFGVSATAIKLARKVEMYQWIETKHESTRKTSGGKTETTTTYSYSKDWRENFINSNSFNLRYHANPPNMRYQSKTMTAQNVNAGDYRLSYGLISKIEAFQPLSVETLPDLDEQIQLSGGGYYIGANPANPEIGDYRITFRIVGPKEVSIVAQQSGQSGSTLAPYYTQSGETLELLEVGTRSAEEMFVMEHEKNRALMWGLRIAGFFLMVLGFHLLTSPIPVMADFISPIGNLVGFTTKLAAFLGAGTLSLITIGAAWIFYRPLIGGALIAGAVLLFIPVIRLKKKR